MSNPDTPTDEPAETAIVVKDAPRQYIRIRPTADPLTSASVQTHVHRLHRLTRPSNRSFLDRFRRSTPQTIECLLVSDGSGRIHYYLGIDGADAIDGFERVLRGLFPNTYEFERIPTDPLATRNEHPDHHAVAVDYLGTTKRPADWQTTLTPFESFLADDNERVPLAALVETMADHPLPVVYQALCRPTPDFSAAIDDRRVTIESNQDTWWDQIINVFFGPPESPEDHLTDRDEKRLELLAKKDAHRAFEVNARLLVYDEDDGYVAEPVAGELTAALSSVDGRFYDVEGRLHRNADATTEDVYERRFTPANYGRFSIRPRKRRSSRGIVADAGELPNFFLLGGDALTAAGARALAPTPGERTAIPRPPVEQLVHYRGVGLTLGVPLTQDDAPDEEPLVLPPPLQRLHVCWFGKTGAGKTTSLHAAIVDNVAATDGADIIIDPKGDGSTIDYLRAHYARFGHLDNVRYFNCAEILPAFSFFDIRDELKAGIPRQQAVDDRVDHYVEILTQIMGREHFERAVRSPDVIRYLLKAAYDPINGGDVFSHRDLHGMVRRMSERQAAPSVSDTDLEHALGGVVANRARTFDEIMGGVLNRVEKIPVDQRLARIFNHVPGEGDPHFDLADYLDEDVVIIFDTGSLRPDAQRVLALVVLSNLWSALRRRKRREPETDHPLVNCYIDEAAAVAVSELLTPLLREGRGFDCSMTLSMQFPAQLRKTDEAAYHEVVNNVSTYVTGNVSVDDLLAKRLMTDDMDARAVGNRLRALRRGQWLVSLPAAFDEPEPRPFLISSAPLPPGHPAGPEPLTAAHRDHFDAAVEAVHERTLVDAGLTLAKPSPADTDTQETGADTIPTVRVDSALPHTLRMPQTVEYDGAIHALRCKRCDNRYDHSIDGMKRAIECCSSLEKVDRDDVPICELNLKLTPEERKASELSDDELMLLQAIFNASQLRYDPLEYDLLYDSMLRLQEYVGVDADVVADLIDAGLLRHDTDHPHRLYTVTPTGREMIGESYREGVDYGHGKGDLEESSLHVLAVEVGRRLLVLHYQQHPDSPVVEVVPYYQLDDQHRLDVAGLDENGEVVVALEAERINHDVKRAVPEDFDKMAACDPAEAIWIVMKQADGHKVLSALNDPLDGNPRVEKTYAKTTPPQQFRIDTPGMTAMYPVGYVRDTLLDADE